MAGNVRSVLRTVANNIRQIMETVKNDITQEVKNDCLQKVLRCKLNISRIRPLINQRKFDNVMMTLVDLEKACSCLEPPSHSPYSASRTSQGKKGRPGVVIDRNQIKLLYNQGFSAKKMAKILGCSYDVIRRKLKEGGMSMRHKFSILSESELDAVVQDIHKSFPNAGCEMMTALLKQRSLVIQRQKVRASLKRIDPAAAAKRWSQTVARRSYSVKTPNSLWHIDGHMKLIRWGIVTHGCIDGFSRHIMYLASDTNNKAVTVLNLFSQACSQFGVPSRVRSDHGGENIDVAMFLNLVRGSSHNSHITGKSVHNQRIERLWRDVFLQVVQVFYNHFYSLEDQGLLNPDNDYHLTALHYVFLPMINSRLSIFRKAWNKHRVRTANNCSPEQLWLTGMLANHGSGHLAVEEIFGNTPSLDVRIELALTKFGLDVNSFVLAPSPVDVHHGIEISDEMSAFIRENTRNLNDDKAKYEKVLEILCARSQ